MRFVVTCARGVEMAVEAELRELGLEPTASMGSVSFDGALEDAYSVAMWSRCASRVLMPLSTFDAETPDELYDRVYAVPWPEHLGPDETLAVDCAASSERREDHTRYLSQRTKDAVVDRIRAAVGARPSVDTKTPDVRLHLHWAKQCTLSLDLAGPLHRRGYRPRGAKAPLRESLAAALLRMAGWTPDAPLVDPMCGSGTILVEAAAMALDIAPGLERPLRSRWRQHDRRALERVRMQAEERLHAGKTRSFEVAGFDSDPAAVELTLESLRAAAIRGVRVERHELRELHAPFERPGHLVVNPPYGERLGDEGELFLLYEALGDVLKRAFGGWQAHVLTSSKALQKSIGLRPSRRDVVFNGPLECRLLHFDVRGSAGATGPSWRKPSAEAAGFANRLRKNEKSIRAWASQQGLGAVRIYDADLPEYNVAVDVYELEAEGQNEQAALIQEYARPSHVDEARAQARLRDVMAVCREVLGIERLELRVRRRTTEGQYERRSNLDERRVVREGKHRFFVNLVDYLDTGLYLDQRKLRARMAQEAAGKRFLNLFAYTCSASVVAASHGATTTNVDLSATYLDWGRENFRLNRIDPKGHRFVRADARVVLGTESASYDVVFLAPPSFSRSKAMRGDLDLKRDHAALIDASMFRVAPGGALYFATHARGFTLAPELASRYAVRELTNELVPRDFVKRPSLVWRLERA